MTLSRRLMHRPRGFAWGLAGCLGWAVAIAVGGSGCRPSVPAKPSIAPRTVQAEALTFMRPEPVGRPITDPPWIGHVRVVDLDRDGLPDILACESRHSEVLWLRQTRPGVFDEIVIGTDMRAPVHVEAADLDGDGDLDVIVSSMSEVFPNNDRIGAIFVLENDGQQNFTPRLIIENIARVTDVQAADLNGDGRIDLAVGQFGYDQGEVRWMENIGPWEYRSHILLELSGAINVCVADMNGDRRPDIVVLISQQWEEIYLFENQGNGRFTSKVIFGSINEDYGSSGISLCDLNGDGRPDILYSNGDGFGPAALPGPRPWHGVQWLENKGGGFFQYRRIGDLPGAYSPVAVDLDQDGAVDVVAVSAYSDWDKKNPRVVSMMWFRNDGRLGFTPRVLAYTPKDLITLDAADLDGDGQPELVTGGFYVFPPYDRMSRLVVWRRASP